MTPEDVALLTSSRGQDLLGRLADHPPEDDLAVADATALRRRRSGLGGGRAHPGTAAPAGRGGASVPTPTGCCGPRRGSSRPPAPRSRSTVPLGSSRSGTHRVADLCCGIGGDLVALAGAGLEVLAVDHDPLTVEVARANARILGIEASVEVRCADVTGLDLRGEGCDAVFVDPARRSGGRRTFDPEGYSPPFSFVSTVAAQVPATAAKVAPGIPHALLRQEWRPSGCRTPVTSWRRASGTVRWRRRR